MLILAIDGALARCSVALLRGGTVLAAARSESARGQAALLPPMAAGVLAKAGLAATALAAVAVGVGPGGFTGLRAAIALAEGLARGAGVRLIGVSTGEALAAAIPDERRQGRALWVAVDNKRGRVVLERFAPGAAWPEDNAAAFDLAALPRPMAPLALAGDAAALVAATLAARGHDVLLTEARLPEATAIARVAAQRLAGAYPQREVAPSYVEPPAVRGA